jgi:hypothetical protein
MTRMLAVMAACLWLGAIDAAAQPPQRLDKAAQAKLDETVAAYAAAWNEPDIAARRQLLEKAWATAGTYTDPTIHLEGRDALVQHISGFLKGLPGARIAPTSRTDLHHGQLRFTWRIVKADGSTLSEGMDFGELDADGRIRRIVGFFGPFSPLDR